MYQAEMLKKLAMKMFLANMNEIVTQRPEDWKRCVQSHPDLTVEITTELAKRQSLVDEKIKGLFKKVGKINSLKIFIFRCNLYCPPKKLNLNF